MRSVKSRAYFEQMKGRGVRIINDNDLQAVTPDAVTKDHFVIVDAVGVCEMDQTDSLPLERKKNVGFEKLLQAVAFGNAEIDVVSSVAARLARMEKKLTAAEQAQVSQLLRRPEPQRADRRRWSRPSIPTATRRGRSSSLMSVSRTTSSCARRRRR